MISKDAEMQRIILGTMAMAGLIVGMCAIASASPATRLLDPSTTVQAMRAEPVYYYWNQHRYRHRSWDKRHRRWRYY